jgi:hypothetical protein
MSLPTSCLITYHTEDDTKGNESNEEENEFETDNFCMFTQVADDYNQDKDDDNDDDNEDMDILDNKEMTKQENNKQQLKFHASNIDNIIKNVDEMIENNKSRKILNLSHLTTFYNKRKSFLIDSENMPLIEIYREVINTILNATESQSADSYNSTNSQFISSMKILSVDSPKNYSYISVDSDPDNVQIENLLELLCIDIVSTNNQVVEFSIHVLSWLLSLVWLDRSDSEYNELINRIIKSNEELENIVNLVIIKLSDYVELGNDLNNDGSKLTIELYGNIVERIMDLLRNLDRKTFISSEKINEILQLIKSIDAIDNANLKEHTLAAVTNLSVLYPSVINKSFSCFDSCDDNKNDDDDNNILTSSLLPTTLQEVATLIDNFDVDDSVNHSNYNDNINQSNTESNKNDSYLRSNIHSDDCNDIDIISNSNKYNSIEIDNSNDNITTNIDDKVINKFTSGNSGDEMNEDEDEIDNTPINLCISQTQPILPTSIIEKQKISSNDNMGDDNNNDYEEDDDLRIISTQYENDDKVVEMERIIPSNHSLEEADMEIESDKDSDVDDDLRVVSTMLDNGDHIDGDGDIDDDNVDDNDDNNDFNDDDDDDDGDDDDIENNNNNNVLVDDDDIVVINNNTNDNELILNENEVSRSPNASIIIKSTNSKQSPIVNNNHHNTSDSCTPIIKYDTNKSPVKLISPTHIYNNSNVTEISPSLTEYCANQPNNQEKNSLTFSSYGASLGKFIFIMNIFI